MRILPWLALLVAGCGEADTPATEAPEQLSTAFVIEGFASVCSPDGASSEDQSSAMIGNTCEPDFRDFLTPFGPPGVIGCVVADFGAATSYGEVQVIASSANEDRCGLGCPEGTDRRNATLDIVGADDLEGSNHVVYGSFTAAPEASTGNPAVPEARRYVFVCQRGDPDGFVTAVDIDVIRVQ